MPVSQPDPWANQPDVTPYPTADERPWSWLEEALAEAERRGAERGWDEGWGCGMSDADADGPDTPNPYRRPAVAPSEPVQQSGDHQDTPDTEKTGVRMNHADPIAQAEIDRLTAENKQLRGKVERVEALAANDRAATCGLPCGACVWPNDCDGAKLQRYIRPVDIRAALADPEEFDV